MKKFVTSALLLLGCAIVVACAGGPEILQATQPVEAETSVFEDATEFRVRLEYPVTWERDPNYDLRFAGSKGFVSITAQEGPGGLAGAVDAIAHHKLLPYGSDPSIEPVTVHGAEGRIIRPSSDQHSDLLGQMALVLVREPPMAVRGESYSYLVIEADGTHFDAVVRSISLLD